MFRITTGMKLSTYSYNLMQSMNTLFNSQDKITSTRNFNSYAEAPAEATLAWRVRDNYMDVVSYKKENDDTTTRYQTAWVTMGTIKTHLEQYNGKTSAVRAANDPTGEAKKQLGDVLSNTADTIIQAMNGAKYGDEFVFGGTDGTAAPFHWEADSEGNMTKLYYRGVNLTPPSMLGGSQVWDKTNWGNLDEKTGIPKDFPQTFEDKWELVPPADPTDPTEEPQYTHTYKEQERDANGELRFDENGNPILGPEKTETVSKDDRDWAIYFKNVQTLNEMSAETQYADLGMGLNEDENSVLVNGTYFNNAIPGINMMGYGVDNDGDPKNLALICKKFDEVLSQVDSNGRVPDELGGNQRVIDLLGKFDEICSFTLSGYTKIDTESKFLTSNSDSLDDQKLNLNEQVLNLEQVDMAGAITQFLWNYNCYNAALKIGTDLLSQSLLDYMR